MTTIPDSEIIGRPAPNHSYTVRAPNPPEDITIEQVREYLGEHPEAKIVVVSTAWIKSQLRAGPWLDLRKELEERGGELHFAGGVSLWEAWFAIEPTGRSRGKGVTDKTVPTGAPMPGVTVSPPTTETRALEADTVLHLGDDAERPAFIEEEIGEVPKDNGAGEPVANIPENIPGDSEAAVDELAHQLTPVVLEQRIRELAADGELGGFRKIAAVLQAEGYEVSHMKVSRVLKKPRS